MRISSSHLILILTLLGLLRLKRKMKNSNEAKKVIFHPKTTNPPLQIVLRKKWSMRPQERRKDIRINIHFGKSLFIKTKTNSKYVYTQPKIKKTERYLLKRKEKTMNNLEIYFWDVRNDTRFFFLSMTTY